jgi:hypothetical protein
MSTTPAHQGTRPQMAARHAGTRLRRCAAALAALISGLLAFAATAPAALAMQAPPPGNQSGSAGVAPAPPTTVRVIVGGMAGWQITLIALGSALLAAAAAVLLYRALAARRAPSTATA